MPFTAAPHRSHRAPWVRRAALTGAASVAALTAALASAGPASATWSVVATDPTTGQIGAAVASCSDVRDLTTTMALVPRAGGAVSIGEGAATTPVLLAAAIRDGGSPAAVLSAVESLSRAGGDTGTQLAVAGLGTGVRASSGPGTAATSGARRATDGSATIQGNLVASPAVLDATKRGFDSTSGPLAARLIAALRSGGEAGGDRGCGGQARAAAVVVIGSKSGLFVPASDPGPSANAADLVASGLTPAQVADKLAQRSVRPAPRGAHAPVVHLSTVVPTGSDAVETIAARYSAQVAAARAVPQAEVFDPEYERNLTTIAFALFVALGLLIAILIISGLRRAERNARPDTKGDEPLRPKPFRGEVANLFDLDLAAALRRSRENERRRQLQRERDSRDKSWTGSTTW